MSYTDMSKLSDEELIEIAENGADTFREANVLAHELASRLTSLKLGYESTGGSEDGKVELGTSPYLGYSLGQALRKASAEESADTIVVDSITHGTVISQGLDREWIPIEIHWRGSHGRGPKLMQTVYYPPHVTKGDVLKDILITGCEDTQTVKHVVRAGDTLSGLALFYYGHGGLIDRILDANPDKISDPNLIQIGEEFIIPDARVTRK